MYADVAIKGASSSFLDPLRSALNLKNAFTSSAACPALDLVRMLALLPLLLLLPPLASSGLSLVPTHPSSGPGYWCSWQAQGRGWMTQASGLDPPAVESFWRKRTHQGWMDQCNQTNAFANDSATGRVGWAWLYPRARQDMFLMLDNGWQLGPEANSDKLLWDAAKWPMFPKDPLSAISGFTAYARAQGWKGAGLWVAGGDAVGVREMKLLHSARVGLLKADGGDLSCAKTALARQYAPGMLVEHGVCVSGCPLNTGARNGTRASLKDVARQAKVLACTDVLRTYDTVRVFSIAEVLDRQAQLLKYAADHLPAAGGGAARRLFGGSGEPSVSVALGGVLQPMRSNLRGVPPLPPALLAYAGEGPGSRHRQHREDEVERLARWGRLAPPFGVAEHGPEQVLLDAAVLEDSWLFRLCDDAAVISHHLENKTVFQAAPARVTRGGLPLPGVTAATAGERQQPQLAPFVVSTRYPNGAVSVTSLGRTRGRTFSEPAADVVQRVPNFQVTAPIGVFGHFGNLTLVFEGNRTAGARAHRQVGPSSLRVWAQDLASDLDDAQDVTSRVHWDGESLSLPGDLLNEIGTMARSRSDDASPPGLVVALRPAI